MFDQADIVQTAPAATDVTTAAQRPLFSIIVPVYNHDSFIGQALNSLQAQSFGDWEAVVVDDGSTDGTPGIVDRFSARNSRIRVIHKANGGTASALNVGLRAARGEWICWLSSDDLFTPEKLSAHVRGIEAHPAARVFFTGFQTLDDLTGRIYDDDHGAIPPRPWQLIGLLNSNFINGITLCVHRTAFEQVGEFDEDNPYGQDYGMNLRLLSAFEAVPLVERCAIKRSHAGQGGRMENRLMFQDCATAAIEFLATADFEGLFPFADLADRQIAARAVERSLDIAMSPHAYMNQLGPHPALALRVMEWLWSCKAPWGDELRRICLWRASAASRRFAGTGIGAMWRALYVLGASVQTGDLRSSAVYPAVVAERAFIDGCVGRDERGHLARYFEKRLDCLPPAVHGCETRGDLLAIGMEEGEAETYSKSGWRVTVLEPGAYTLRMERWGLSVGIGTCKGLRLTRTLCRVGSWDAASASEEYAAIVAPSCRTQPVGRSGGDIGERKASSAARVRRLFHRLAGKANGLTPSRGRSI